MKNILRDLLRLVIIITVLCTMVFFMDGPGFEGKSDILYGVVGGGVTAFIVMFVVRKLRKPKK